MKLELMMRDREREGFARGERSGFEKGRQSGEQSGFARGEQSGFARGEQSERLKNAKSLLGLIKPEEIANCLGLPLEEVLRLSKK